MITDIIKQSFEREQLNVHVEGPAITRDLMGKRLGQSVNFLSEHEQNPNREIFAFFVHFHRRRVLLDFYIFKLFSQIVIIKKKRLR